MKRELILPICNLLIGYRLRWFRVRNTKITSIAASYLCFRVCVAVYTVQNSGRIHVIGLRKAAREKIREYAETKTGNGLACNI